MRSVATEADKEHVDRGAEGGLWRHTPFVLGIFISALFTALFVSSLRLDALRAIPARIHYSWVIAAALIFLIEFPLRTLRWQILLAPITPTRFTSLLSVTLIGFMANNVLPARAGDLVRPVLAARKVNRPLSPILMTTVMERAFDILGLLTVFLVMFLTLPHSGAVGMSPELLATVRRLGTTLGLIGLLGMAFLFLMAWQEHRARSTFMYLTKILPKRLRNFVMGLFDGLALGLGSFRTVKGPLAAALISALMWLNGSLAIWVMTRSFGFELPFAAACFQSVTLALAVVVPQAPGFIGVWQVAVSETLKAWGVPDGDAQGFAVVFWLASFVPITLLGLSAMWAQGLKLKNLWHTTEHIEDNVVENAVVEGRHNSLD